MSGVGKHTFRKASLERRGWAEGRVPQEPQDEGAEVAAQALCKPCTGKQYMTAESRPPVMPGQPCPQGHAGAQTQSWDTQADQRRLQATWWGPGPPASFCPRPVAVGGFPWIILISCAG